MASAGAKVRRVKGASTLVAPLRMLTAVRPPGPPVTEIIFLGELC